MYPLYIDPGTGSAIFSILIGAAATLYFLGRALIMKAKAALSGGKISKQTGPANSYAIYNEGKQYSNVFKPVLDEFEKRGIDLLYLTSSEDDPLLSEPYNHIKKEYIGEGNKAFSRLTILNARVVLMTTPGLGVYQLKRSKEARHYSHILHATTDATMYRCFSFDYFDSVLLTGEYQAEDIRILEQKRNTPPKELVVVGCSYLDIFEEKIKLLPKEETHPFTVLLSPSWGPSALLSRFGEKLLDPLLKTGMRVIVRPHPQSKKSEEKMLEALEEKYKDSGNLIWDYESENIRSLSKADIMISDFSGIVYDYAFLFDKPVIYLLQGIDLRPYDADDLGEGALEKLWLFKTLKEIGVELKEEDFPRIREIIERASDSEDLREARKKAKDAAWQFRGEAGKRTADYLISLEAKTAT